MRSSLIRPLYETSTGFASEFEMIWAFSASWDMLTDTPSPSLNASSGAYLNDRTAHRSKRCTVQNKELIYAERRGGGRWKRDGSGGSSIEGAGVENSPKKSLRGDAASTNPTTPSANAITELNRADVRLMTKKMNAANIRNTRSCSIPENRTLEH